MQELIQDYLPSLSLLIDSRYDLSDSCQLFCRVQLSRYVQLKRFYVL